MYLTSLNLYSIYSVAHLLCYLANNSSHCQGATKPSGQVHLFKSCKNDVSLLQLKLGNPALTGSKCP